MARNNMFTSYLKHDEELVSPGAKPISDKVMTSSTKWLHTCTISQVTSTWLDKLVDVVVSRTGFDMDGV